MNTNHKTLKFKIHKAIQSNPKQSKVLKQSKALNFSTFNFQTKLVTGGAPQS